jgi:hypothetical protein
MGEFYTEVFSFSRDAQCFFTLATTFIYIPLAMLARSYGALLRIEEDDIDGSII